MSAVQAPTQALEVVTFNLYRDVHKGIRRMLFALTEQAGSVDPSSRSARADVAANLDQTIEFLRLHAHHEDAAIGATLETDLPDLGAEIEHDHDTLEGRLVDLQTIAYETVEANTTAQRDAMYRMYVELASFTSSYLAHQDLEERVVMPAVEKAVGVEAVVGIHLQIIGSIPPDQMAASLAQMFPAMNIDDRAELLGGMRASAPAEVFEGVWGLTGSVLTPPDFTALGQRLQIAA